MTNHGKTLPRWSHHTSKEQHIQHLPPRDRSHRSTFAPTYHKPWPLARLQGTSDVWKKGLDEKKTPDPQRWPNSLGLQILFCWDCTTHLLWKIDVYCFESIYIDQLMYWCHIRFSGVNNFDAYPCQNQMSDPRNHRCPGFEGDQQLVEKQQQHVQGTKGPSLWPWLDTFGGAPWFINPMKTSSMCITNKNHREIGVMFTNWTRARMGTPPCTYINVSSISTWHQPSIHLLGARISSFFQSSFIFFKADMMAASRRTSANLRMTLELPEMWMKNLVTWWSPR